MNWQKRKERWCGSGLWAWALALWLGAGMGQAAETGKAAVGAEATETLTLGGGCFWCLEAFFESLQGVRSVVSGYAGGTTMQPTYKQVCTGETGHAEVVQIEFNPKVISLATLLDVFWEMHDPTTLNRQGADEGTQYRSVILYANAKQKQAAEQSKLLASPKFDRLIVTEIVPLERFYPAEPEHQDYFRKHPRAPYCAMVISPKMPKLKQLKQRLKLE